jgi:hypothetical protein
MQEGPLPKMNKGREGSAWVGAAFFLILFLIFGIVGIRNVKALRARNAIRQMLDAPDNEFDVKLSGRSAPDAGAVLQAVRGIRLRMSHHTYPAHEITVVIRGKHGLLELTLARDSGLPKEYWVFWTREEGDPNRLEIGRIETSLLDRD